MLLWVTFFSCCLIILYFFYDPLLNRSTATWNLSVRHVIYNGNKTKWKSNSVCNHTSDKKKSDNHEAGVQFVKHMYDYQQNEMTQSPITNE